MMKLLKHITAFILLMAFLFPLATPVILQLQQLYVQRQMLEALEEEALITITVDDASVQWIKKGKECVVYRELFDVKTIKKQQKKLVLTGLYDKKEKQIKLQLTTHTKEQKDQHQQAKTVKQILQFAATPPAEIFILKTDQLPSVQLSTFKNSCYQSVYSLTTTPPPKTSV
jgi:hypothetical protein